MFFLMSVYLLVKGHKLHNYVILFNQSVLGSTCLDYDNLVSHDIKTHILE